jgi:hypothetical protein
MRKGCRGDTWERSRGVRTIEDVGLRMQAVMAAGRDNSSRSGMCRNGIVHSLMASRINPSDSDMVTRYERNSSQ